MIRIARLTDYGIALMTRMARGGPEDSFTARDLAAELSLPMPTVSKLLKQLVRAELLSSQRGPHGGYQLAAAPEEISIARLIDALEGPIAMTDCTWLDAAQPCDFEAFCGVRGNWQWINRRVKDALEGVTLAEMAVAALRRSEELKNDLRTRSLKMEKS